MDHCGRTSVTAGSCSGRSTPTGGGPRCPSPGAWAGTAAPPRELPEVASRIGVPFIVTAPVLRQGPTLTITAVDGTPAWFTRNSMYGPGGARVAPVGPAP